MAIPSTARGLSPAQQAIILRSRFPTAQIDLKPTAMTWTGTIRPTPCSRDYTIKIVYRPWLYPHVTTIEPLESRPGENLPHTYRDGSLCLHEAHEWTHTMPIADTIVVWAAEWLAHYELWKVRGRWYGDNEPGPTVSPALPFQKDENRAERRQEQHDRPRRDRRRERSRDSRHGPGP